MWIIKEALRTTLVVFWENCAEGGMNGAVLAEEEEIYT